MFFQTTHHIISTKEAILMGVVFLIVLLIMIAPVRIAADIHFDRQTDADVILRVWGVGHTFRLRTVRDRTGRHIILLPHKPLSPPRKAPDQQVQRGMILLGAFLRSNHARRFVVHHIYLEKLHASVQLALSDAAKTATLTGLISGLASMIPCQYRDRVRIRVIPDFFHDHITASSRCILFFHLGTLLITAAMMLIAWVLETREHRQLQTEEA